MKTWFHLLPLILLATITPIILILLPTVNLLGHTLGGGPLRQFLVNLVAGLLPTESANYVVEMFDNGSIGMEIILTAPIILHVSYLGLLIVAINDADEIMMSEHHSCPHCDLSFPELSPPLFSFNSPLGMCPTCNGLGVQLQVDPALIVTKPHLSTLDGASPWYGEVRKKVSDLVGDDNREKYKRWRGRD